MKQIIPEIYVRECQTALKFYSELFRGEVKNLQMSDDLDFFRDRPGKVIHSELHVNSRCVFYFVDILEESRSRTGNVTIMLHLDSEEEIRHIYSALGKRGSVLMELQKTFWGALHAIVTDHFGAPWALNYAETRE